MMYEDNDGKLRYIDDAKTKALRGKYGTKSLSTSWCPLCAKAIDLTRSAIEQLAEAEKDAKFAHQYAVIAGIHAKSLGEADDDPQGTDALLARVEKDIKWEVADNACIMLQETVCEVCGQVPWDRPEADHLFVGFGLDGDE
jgi:hypothetical protein